MALLPLKGALEKMETSAQAVEMYQKHLWSQGMLLDIVLDH